MGETLEEVIDNQGKLHQLEMIKGILYQSYCYVNGIFGKIQDDFYDIDNLEDYIIENIVNTIKGNLDILQKFL